MGDLLTEVGLSGFLHLGKNHRRDFFGSEVLVRAVVFDCDDGLAELLANLEGPVLHVALDIGIIHFATNKTLRVEDSVLGVGVVCVFGGVTDTDAS